MSRVLRFVVVMMLAAIPAVGQTKPAEKTAEQRRQENEQAVAQERQANERATEQKRQENERAMARAAEARTLAEGQPVNLRLDLTITDQRADAAVISKTVSMTVADRHSGRIRTQGDVRTPAGFRPVILNIDCQPTMLGREPRARVILTIEYRPVAAEAENERASTPNVNESLTVILEDGKPMVISQSADPVSDRKVKVEVKMTVVR
jgi:hypothetical protein